MNRFLIQKNILASILFLGSLSITVPIQADEVKNAINTLLEVKAQGVGNEKAAEALKIFQKTDEKSLFQILVAFKDSNQYSANYLFAAFEIVAENLKKQSGPALKDNLEKFILNLNHSPRARRIAYEYLLNIDATVSNRLIPNMLKDPSPEFRRDSVALLITQGESEVSKEKNKLAKSTFQKALTGAVDEDQVTVISEQLKKLGIETNLKKHFGILSSWRIIGPFENKDGIGYNTVYPPEKEIEFSKTYDGKETQVKWQTISTEDNHGLVDIAKDIGPNKGSVMYAIFDFNSSISQNVVLKFGTPNAWKIWVNGKLASSLEEYHRGTKFDQHKIPANLKSGHNSILIKLCENEQKEKWAQQFQFQIRVCDPTGSAVIAVK